MVSDGREAFIQFVAELRRLRQLAGAPSLNRLVALTRNLEQPLPRSTISDKLNAKSLPEWHFVVSFATACKLHADQTGVQLPEELVDLSYWDSMHLWMLRMVDRATGTAKSVGLAFRLVEAPGV